MRTIITATLIATTTLAGLVVAAEVAEAQQDKVTICHAAGLDGTTKYVEITVGYPAAFGPAGHFYEDGTPQAGHEDDILGPCPTPPTEPPVTDPPVTDPPVTEPPVTEPPVIIPPVTEPPVTDPPVTDPPAVTPPVTQPPVPPVVETVDPPVPPAPEPATPGMLPATGTSSWVLAALGAVCLMLGGAATWAARRK